MQLCLLSRQVFGICSKISCFLEGLMHQLNLLTAPEAMLALLLLPSCPSLVLCVKSLCSCVCLVSRDNKNIVTYCLFFCFVSKEC